MTRNCAINVDSQYMYGFKSCHLDHIINCVELGNPNSTQFFYTRIFAYSKYFTVKCNTF